MIDALDRAEKQGVATFVASDHVTIRTVGEGEGLPTGDPDQASRSAGSTSLDGPVGHA